MQRAFERARAYPHSLAPGSLRGELAHVSIGRVLSLLAGERRTGILVLVSRAGVASAFLRDGAVVQIQLPADRSELDADAENPGEPVAGPERLQRLLGWRDGRFEFTAGEVSCADRIGVPVSLALLQHAGLRELDVAS